MAGRFARLRRSRDDDPTTDDQPTEAAAPVEAGAAEGAEQPTEALPAIEASDVETAAAPAGEGTASGAQATDADAPGEAQAESVPTGEASEAPAGDAAATPAGDAAVTEPQVVDPEDEGPPGFLARGRLRRRLRFVRRARELALRDLGGLVFDLHRFARDRGDLVEQKLAALTALDAEMRALEAALDERREVTVLREPGLTGCPRCGAVQASDARFCSSCGLPLERGAALPAGPTPAPGVPASEPTPAADAPAAASTPDPAPGSDQPAADEPSTSVP